MAGYFIAHLAIVDEKQFQQYWRLTVASVQAAGGRILIQERRPHVLQGPDRQAVLVIEFDSVADVRRWYGSIPQQMAAKWYVPEMVFSAVIVEGHFMPDQMDPASKIQEE